MSDMNNSDFDAMARQTFGLANELSDYPFVRVSVPQLRQFARQVYNLGEANGRYDEKLRQTQPWRQS